MLAIGFTIVLAVDDEQRIDEVAGGERGLGDHAAPGGVRRAGGAGVGQERHGRLPFAEAAHERERRRRRGRRALPGAATASGSAAPRARAPRRWSDRSPRRRQRARSSARARLAERVGETLDRRRRGEGDDVDLAARRRRAGSSRRRGLRSGCDRPRRARPRRRVRRDRRGSVSAARSLAGKRIRLPARVAGGGEAGDQRGGMEFRRHAVNPPAALAGRGGGGGADRGDAQVRRQRGAALGHRLDRVRAGEHQPVEVRELGELASERLRDPTGGAIVIAVQWRTRAPAARQPRGERAARRLVAGHDDAESGRTARRVHGWASPARRMPARIAAAPPARSSSARARPSSSGRLTGCRSAWRREACCRRAKPPRQRERQAARPASVARAPTGTWQPPSSVGEQGALGGGREVRRRMVESAHPVAGGVVVGADLDRDRPLGDRRQESGRARRYSVMWRSRPSRLTPAAARTIASYLPSSTRRTRVGTLPRRSTSSRSGR